MILYELQRTFVSNVGNGLELGVCETIEKLISMSQRKPSRTYTRVAAVGMD